MVNPTAIRKEPIAIKGIFSFIDNKEKIPKKLDTARGIKDKKTVIPSNFILVGNV